MFAGNYAPEGWAFCDGAKLLISSHEVLFTLIGTTYGGNGQTTFRLPDLRGRVPVHAGVSAEGTDYAVGDSGGEERVGLTVADLPSHSHTPRAIATAGNREGPEGALWAGSGLRQYGEGQPDAVMDSRAIGRTDGGGVPHDNLMPYRCIHFIIALQGLFPSRG